MVSRGYEKVEQNVDGLFEPVLKVKGEGRVDLGAYATPRLAAVAHDVARLIFIHERRPTTDLTMDQGLHHPADGYLVDPTFKQLLHGGSSFAVVCEMLRSGALADQFLCAADRATRKTTSSATSGGDRSTLSRQLSRLAPRDSSARAAAAPPAEQHRPQQQQQQECPELSRQAPPPPQQQQQQKQQQEPQQAPRDLKASPFQSPAAASPPPPPAGAGAGAAAAAAAAAAGSPRRRQSKWIEWPSASGQFCSLVTAAALKGNIAVPVKIKKELFQCAKGSVTTQVVAHDLAQGSSARWAWEVRDQVGETKTTVHLAGLAPFFKHYQAAAGDVLVAVASAPGAVKAAVWKGDSQDAAKFKAHAERQANRQAGGGAAGGKKRVAEDSLPRKQAAKAAKPAEGASVPAAAAAASADLAATAADMVAAAAGATAHHQASASPDDASRQLSKSSSLPQPRQQQHNGPVKRAAAGSPLPHRPPAPSEQPQQQAAQQPLPQQQVQQQPSEEDRPKAAQRQQELARLAALADQGIDPASCDDTVAASPTAHNTAQSPYRRQQALPPPAFASNNLPVAIKQERVSPPQQQATEAAAAAGAHAAAGDSGAAAPAATHSPARMSCADRQPPAVAGAAGAGAEAVAIAGEGSGGVPDPYQLYRSMKGAVREAGLPAEQRHAFWLIFMRWAPWQQRIAADEVADMQADGPAWRDQLRSFIQHELRLAALLPAGAPGEAGGSTP